MPSRFWNKQNLSTKSVWKKIAVPVAMVAHQPVFHRSMANRLKEKDQLEELYSLITKAQLEEISEGASDVFCNSFVGGCSGIVFLLAIPPAKNWDALANAGAMMAGLKLKIRDRGCGHAPEPDLGVDTGNSVPPALVPECTQCISRTISPLVAVLSLRI